MSSITTSTGITVSTRDSTYGPLVILDHPDAPNDMRLIEAGQIRDGGFQPSPFLPGALSPETLRAIADLIDDAHQAANQPSEWERAAFILEQSVSHLRAVPDTEPGDTK